MAGKQYEVVRHFRRVDPKTGDVTEHAPGESYTGPMENEDHYVGNEGPDGKGPLVMAKSEIAENQKAAEEQVKAVSAPATDSKGK